MSRITNQLPNNSLIKSLWFGGLTLLCLIPAILSVLFAPIVPDTAYYLSIVERINDGIVPYRDLALGYTPLVFYLTLGLKKLFAVGINYEFYMIAHFILQWICAYLVYKIGRQIIKSKELSFYASILFLLASHWNEGNFFLLETPAIFFGLSAILLVLRNSAKTSLFLIIGLLASFSFLSKQYGLGFLGLIVYLTLFNNQRWKQLGWLFLGFSVPLVVCNSIWGDDFFSNIFNSYGEKHSILVGLWAVAKRTTYLFIRIPILLAAIYYIPYLWKSTNVTEKRNIGLLVMGVLGFMLQFYFAKFGHYYLFAIPFVALLPFLLLELVKGRKTILRAIVVVTMLLSIYATYHDQVYKLYYAQKNIKVEQYQLAKEIIARVDRNKTLYIADIGLINQYYLTNMAPPNLKTIGYTFAIALTEKTHLQQINAADYILKFSTEYNHYNLNTAKVQETLKARPKQLLTNKVVMFEK